MPDNMKAVLYARVSSDRQEQEDTVQSQLGELRAALEDAGVSDWQEFIDEGYARDNLVRPALDRLRDLAAQRDVSKVYVQAPDRLASGARLVILAEEFQEQDVDVVFLKGSVESTPEGKLLLHMQGAIAEYERTKISERTRRGKLYWARQGAMVGGHAPYGYRFIRRSDIHRARLEISEFQASVVREMYRLVLEERLSTRGLARYLEGRAIPTPRGANQWSPTTIDRILRNPVYMGTFFYQRTESALPSKRLSTDPYKQSRKTGSKPRPQGDWIAIPVPVIVDEPVWNAVQGQLRQNSLHSPRNNKRHGYLLRGLVRCPRCGGAYTGYSQKGYRGYRCQRRDPTVSSTGQRCKPGAVSAQRLEDAVWDAISESLQQPQLLADEYRRRLSENAGAQPFAEERKKLGIALKRVAAQEDRVTEAYVSEAMDLDRYKEEMEKLKSHRQELDRSQREIDQRQRQKQDTQKALAHLERFCHQVSKGLTSLTFDERQQLLRLVIERITVENGVARIDTVIPPDQDNLRNRYPEPVEPPTALRQAQGDGYANYPGQVGSPCLYERPHSPR